MNEKSRAIIVLGIFFVISISILFINLNSFIYLANSQYSDIEITHYPNILFLQRSLIEYRQLPLWSNLIYAGYPFFANPLSGLWYLPGYLAILFSLPLGINISIIIHLAIMITGMFLFLRKMGNSFMGATFGALAFGLSAKIFAHIGAGHLTLLYSLSWTPWLLWSGKENEIESNLRNVLLAGIFFGLIILADPRWSIPSFLLWITFKFSQTPRDDRALWSSVKNIFKSIFFSTIIGLIFSIVMWLPLLQFIGHSTRSNLTISDRLVYSLPVDKLFGLLVPDFGGFAEWVIYPGAVVFLLAVMVIFLPGQNRPMRYWIVVAVISLLLALGEHTPVLQLIFSLPGFSLLRVPSRFIFLFQFALVVLAVFGFDYLIENVRHYKFDRLFFLAPILSFIIMICIGVFFVTKDLPGNFFWAAIIFSISFSVVGISLHKKVGENRRAALILLCLIIDILIVSWSSLKFDKAEIVLAPDPAIERILMDYEAPERVYTPSYGISQAEAAFWDIHQINGIDPMQIEDYVSLFTSASGIPYDQYSVTLPPFNNGEIPRDDENACPDVDLLKKLSTRFILSDYSLDYCDLEIEEIMAGEKFIYHFSVDGLQAWWKNTSENQESIDIEIKQYSPNEIVLTVSGPGELVLSEIFYPGWYAKIGKNIFKIEKNDAFRMVRIPEGQQEVKIFFLPPILITAVGINLMFWITLVGFIFYKKRNQLEKQK